MAGDILSNAQLFILKKMVCTQSLIVMLSCTSSVLIVNGIHTTFGIHCFSWLAFTLVTCTRRYICSFWSVHLRKYILKLMLLWYTFCATLTIVHLVHILCNLDRCSFGTRCMCTVLIQITRMWQKLSTLILGDGFSPTTTHSPLHLPSPHTWSCMMCLFLWVSYNTSGSSPPIKITRDTPAHSQ